MGNKIVTQVEDLSHSEVAHKTEFSEPKKYKIFLLNDDYTPMDFVVETLIRFFYFSENAATQIMLQIHKEGRGLCGIFSRDVAETKVVLVNEFSRLNQHPLLCIMEKE